MKKRLRLNFKDRIATLGKGIDAIIDAFDLVFLISVAAVGYGVAQIYQPAAWIVVGAIGIVVAIRTPGGEK